MTERHKGSGTLHSRVLLSAIFILGLILVAGPVSPVRPLSTTAQGDAPFPPEGDWYTYANGDDVLVLELEGNTLWAGTRAGGLIRWDTTNGSFVQFLKPQDPLVGNTIRDIYIDADGNKWLATDHGLSVLQDQGTPDKADDVWYTYTRETTNGNLPSNRVTAVARDEAGFLWIGTSQYWDSAALLDIGEEQPVEAPAFVGGGLAKVNTKDTLDPADDEWLQTYTVANTVDASSCRRGELAAGLASDNVTDILPVAGDRIWVATQKHWSFSRAASDSGGSSHPCAFLLANPNNPGRWVQILGGLSRLDHGGTPETDDDTWKTWTCETGPQRDSNVGCIINQLELDRNGYVWAAMRSKGVIAFPYNGDRTLNYVQFNEFDGLASNDVEYLAFGPQGDDQWQDTVWLATFDATSGSGRGVSVLDHNGTIRTKDDDIWNERTQNPFPGAPITTAQGLPDDRVQAMVVGAGRIWMGIGGMYGEAHGISTLDLEQWAFQEPLVTARSGLPYNYITDLAVGQEGTRWENQVWVATGNKRERKYGVGALLLNTQGSRDPSDDTWSRFSKENTDDNGVKPWTGLASDNITALAIHGDEVWFGTQPATGEFGRRGWTWLDGGLSVYDGEGWTIRTDANTGGETAGMLDDRISALAIGCIDEIWIGVGSLRDNSGLGINVVDTKGDSHNRSNDEWWPPIRYRSVPSNLITGIAPDCTNSQVWVSAVPYFTGPGGTLGGGVGRYEYDTGRWTTWTADDGLETFAEDRMKGEIQNIAVGADGTVWAGAWGTRGLLRQELIDSWPFRPDGPYTLAAAINWFRDGVWSSHIFENDGWVSSIAIDNNGVVWVGTSRGGMDLVQPDGKEDDSLADRAVGGIKLTVDGTTWTAWTPDNSPVVTTDIEVIRIAPDGDVWVGTSGWGLMHFDPKEPPTPTPSVTQTPTGTVTPPTATPASGTPTPSPTLFVTAEGPSPTPTARIHRAFLPMFSRNWFGRPIPVPTALPYTATPTPSPTPIATLTPTPTRTPTITHTPTPAPPTATPTVTPTPTVTVTQGPTSTPTITPTPSPVPTGVWCPSPSPVCSDVNLPVFPAKNLYDIEFIDSVRGFIVGQDGFVARTQDGGNTWNYGTWGIETLRDVVVVSNQVAFVAGDNQTILRTTNGGGYFQRMQLPSAMIEGHEDFWAIDAVSANDAWVMGHDTGCILHWDGQAWNFGIGVGCTGYQYTGVAMPEQNQGWAISADGFIYRYNGTWTEFSAARAGGPLGAIKMFSPTEGWAAGSGGVTARYTNGRWTGSVISGAFAGGGITGLHLRTPDDAWATAAMGTGDRPDGAIYRYNGNRWVQVEYRPLKQLNGIWVNDTLTNGWAIGNEGFVMRYAIPTD